MTLSSVPGPGRRSVLGAAALAVLAATHAPGPTASSPGQVARRVSARPGPADPRRLRTPFTLGVASGDPLPDGFVLWTRLAPEPLDPDGQGGMPHREVVVEWEVAEDAGVHPRQARRGAVRAVPLLGALGARRGERPAPGREYFYRFRAAGHLSRRSGAPGPRRRTGELPGSLTVAVASCAQLRARVLHRLPPARRGGARPRAAPGRLPLRDAAATPTSPGRATSATTSARRRSRWPTTGSGTRSTRPTPTCRPRTRRRPGPWSSTTTRWTATGRGWCRRSPDPRFRRRRASAFRAYYEHMPLRRSSLPRGPGMRIYRRLRWGDLATFHLLDTRQYRDDQACGDGGWWAAATGSTRGARSPAPARSAWLLDGLGRSDARWDLIGQQVFLAQKDALAGSPRQLEHGRLGRVRRVPPSPARRLRRPWRPEPGRAHRGRAPPLRQRPAPGLRRRLVAAGRASSS